MSLIRWNPVPVTPLRELTSIQNEIDRLFDGFITQGTSRGALNGLFTPAADIEETPEEFMVKVDLPGVAHKDVKVSMTGDTLTIRGERRTESSKSEGHQHRVERVYGTFERSFTLASPVRADQVKAHYRDGVLEVRIPKAEEARMREIAVQAG